MNLVQKIILFFTFGFLILGSVVFLLSPVIPVTVFLLYCLITSIIGIGLSYALKDVSFLVHTKTNETSIQYNNNNPTLYSFRSVFPLDLFPDRYIIQEKTVSIVRKKFFFNAWAETVPIKDLGGVRLYSGPVFASLWLTKKTSTRQLQQIELRSLWKKDALTAKEVIDGLILKENKIVTVPKAVSSETKKDIVQELGHTKELEKEI